MLLVVVGKVAVALALNILYRRFLESDFLVLHDIREGNLIVHHSWLCLPCRVVARAVLSLKGKTR